MAPPLLQLTGIRLTFGGTPLLDGADLSVEAGERIALVGRNGSGKSTLLKIAAGLVEPQEGEVFRQPSATIRYLPQAPDFGDFAIVRDYVAAGLGPADDPHRASYLLDHLGLTGDEAPATLSGGEARRAALARVLAPQPDIMLLDEPTNHLDLSTIEWLEEELSRSPSAIILISHDRRFLERVSRATVWLDRGRTQRLDRGFGHFEEWRDRLLEEEEKEQHKLGRQIVREEHWLRYGVTARRKRNMRRLGELQEMRARHRGHKGPEGAAAMKASDAAESGKLVIEAKGISKSFGDLTVVRDFSIRVARGDRIGLVGPNGAGKTTLLKMLTGELAPDTGTVRLGANLTIATLDQKRESLDPEESVQGFLTRGAGDWLEINGERKHAASYLKDFLFKPEQARTPVKELSGGERARLVLARILATPATLLVLDEPTNDRDFLDRTVTSTIAPEGDGRWVEYAGGYADMLAQRGSKAFGRRGGEAKKAAPAAGKPAAAPKEPAKKLSYKQKFALESLPKKMEAVSAEIGRLEAKLSDPALYAKEPAAYQKLAAALDAERAKLAAMEEEWLELEMLREEIEG
jgi:ATP-binding cassette subfamily F protein uup